MTLFDVEELTKYWAEHPPPHILIAAYLGAGKQQRHRTRPSLDDSRSSGGSNPEEVLAELGSGFQAGDVHAGLTPVVLDFGALRRQTADR